ncbi:MAG TPA: lamin tail domain-containing protein, partial [Lacipirellula sp.]
MAGGERKGLKSAPQGRTASRQLSVERLESRIAMAAQPIINEILASNSGVIQDADGEYSDFIELYNAGDATVNLSGWHLTDDDDDLDRWTLPAVDLGAGQYLLVFASGKNRAVAGSELHTNFALGANGEFLALVRPNLTIASQFSPGFPSQYEDVSYGVGGNATETILAGQGSPTQVLVPSSGSLGTGWTLPGYAPTGWQTGQLGVGYSAGGVPPTPTTLLQVDFNDRGNAGNTLPGFSSFVLGGTSSVVFGSTSRTFGGLGVTVTDASGFGYDDRWRSTPLNGGAFTEGALLQDFIFSQARSAGSGGLDVTIEGLTPGDVYTLTVWSYDAASSGLRTSDWTANGLSVVDYSFDGSSATPPANDTYRMGLVVAADGLGRIVLQGRQDEEASDYGVFLNALRVETGDTLSDPGGGVVRVDFNSTEGEAGAANTESGYATMTLDENGATIDGVTITFSGYNGGELQSRDRSEPIEAGDFTLDQVYDDFIFVPSQRGAGMEIFLEGLAPNVEYDLVLRSLDAFGSGVRLATWTEVSGAVPVTIAAPYSYDGSIPPTSNDDNAIRARLITSPQGTLVLRGVQVGNDTSVFANALELSRSSFQEFVGVDVQVAMKGVSSSAYVRVPFSVANPAEIDQLLMDVRYDAGFVAYLNGQEVARRNAPTAPGVAPAYNAAATLERGNSEAVLPETIDLSAFKHLLSAGGGNVLAIHGLNSEAADEDFLLAPQLRAVEIAGGSLRFFETPTPGALNGEGVIDFVANVEMNVPHGFYNAPFSLTLSNPTAGAQVYYTYDGSAPDPDNPSAILYTGPIQVNRTTVVRAGAVLDDYGDSLISTATYIFLDDVVNQSINPHDPASNPFGLDYPSLWQANAPGDFNMDPRVTGQWDDNNPANTDFGIREALQSIPTMSIVMDHDDLWNFSRGIYPNATRQGDLWRRPGSIEFVDPTTGEDFQYNVGVQMHGAASRDNVRTKKHSFRLIFNSEFDGPGRLNFPLFDNSNFADINTVVLKAAFTDSFATRTASHRYSPLDSTYTRDVWMMDSQRAMGSLAPEATYVHLYINGLYWGLYYPTERVDDAYLASRLGGAEEDWDVIKDFNELFRGEKTAWNAMFALASQMAGADAATANSIYQQLQGNNADGTRNSTLPAYLDADNLIDYIILHIYAGVEDWPSHNWVAARNRVNPGEGFRFYTWDQEIALDGRFRDRTDHGASTTPAGLYAQLRNSPEFRLRFADRVQEHLFNDGALTVEAATERWLARADQIEAAIIAESARWGDAREGEIVSVPPTTTIPLMTVDLWRDSVADVVDMLPQYHSLAVSRLQADGLFTMLAAPQFSHHGGPVAPGHLLSMIAPGGGTIYFTTNGEDPRELGGGVNPTAAVYSGAITINSTTTVKARVLSGSTWSALAEATFGVLQGSGGIVISELNYHPHGPTAAEAAAVPGVQEDDFEFIEILNTHPTDSLNLQNMSLAGGLSFTFGNVSLAPGQRGVVVENVAAFQARYGTGHLILGSWSGGASNSGELIELRSSTGSVIMALNYTDMDPWSEAADGDGATLELIDPFNTPAERLGKWYSWRASTELGGTPGAAAQGAIGVVINEVRSRATSTQSDAIELHNATNQPVNVGGWYLSDSGGNPLKFRIPTGTVIAAGGYLVFDEDDFNPLSPAPGQTPFAINGFEGDDVFLVIPNGTGSGVAKIVDSVHFGASLDGETLGRLPNAEGRLAPMASTLGAANTAARVGPVVITEIGYRPGSPSAAALAIDPSIAAAHLEFIELHNRTGAAVDLTNYRLAGDVAFDLPAGMLLAAGQTLVVVPFNPATNPARAAAFRAHYGVNGSVALVGPYAGSLLDGGARVELQLPDSPPPDMPAFIPHITSDEALYDNLAPWASIEPGNTTLQRTTATSYGNAAGSWHAASATPGAVQFIIGTAGDFDEDDDVDGRDLLAWQRGLGTTAGATRGQG